MQMVLSVSEYNSKSPLFEDNVTMLEIGAGDLFYQADTLGSAFQHWKLTAAVPIDAELYLDI